MKKWVGLMVLCGCCAAGNLSETDDLHLEIVPLPAESGKSFSDEEERAFVMVEKGWYTWCPSVIQADDGSYHMFLSRWPKSIGFNSWLTHSMIVHKVADRPEGPYREVGIAIPDSGEGRNGWFNAHNPKIKKFDGRYYLYFIQTRGKDMNDDLREAVGRAGRKHPKWESEIRPNQRPFVAVSDSLDGPWTVSEKPIIEPAKTIKTLAVNPAVCKGPDGCYFMIVKGDRPGAKRFRRNQAIATAPGPEGPWTIRDRAVIDDFDTEDCSIWYDSRRKRFYTVFHAKKFIGMMTSEDGLDWRKAGQFQLSPREVPFDDGGKWEPQRMERPFVLTDGEGQPLMLFVACKKDDLAVNVAMKLVPAE